MVPSTPRTNPVRLVIVTVTTLGLALTALTAPALSAHADPVYPSSGQVRSAQAAVGDKSAQIAVVEGQLRSSNVRLAELQSGAEAAAEKYNLARIQLQQRTDAATSSGSRATEARRTAEVASDKLGQSAAAAYRQGGSLGELEPFLSSRGPAEVLDRTSVFQLISDIRLRISKDAGASSLVAGDLGRQAARAQAQQLAGAQAAESARVAAQTLVDLAAAETATIQKKQSAMVAQLATLRSTSVTLERARQSGLQAAAERQAAAAAQARIAAQARAVARSGGAGGSGLRGRGPGPGGKAPAGGQVSPVVAFAGDQVGEPYRWGAAGPDSWDCSGLTMLAWRQAGVSLSHYTGYQWSQSRRVPLSDLQPGDLVFFGASGPSSHHVGLYVGGGQMIEAPRAGMPVRYASIWRSGIVGYGGRP